MASILDSIRLPAVPLLNNDDRRPSDGSVGDGNGSAGNVGDPPVGTSIHGTDVPTAGTAGTAGAEGAAGG